jgi:adenylosuccinate synthase
MKQAVIGLGFGDEGKGISTSFLCSKQNASDTVVVRANSGQQAGHTVVYNNFRHVFSSFGSGTLQGFSTYISKFCTINPSNILNEYKFIADYSPKLIIDPLAMITTPYDVAANRTDNVNVGHGTTGQGFGKTIERNEKGIRLYFQDLFFKDVFLEKLIAIATHHNVEVVSQDIFKFVSDCSILTQCEFVESKSFNFIKDSFKNIIFEQAQGILLDMDFGFFPNVTRSNTTSKNIVELCPDLDEVYYITRTYLTRHGNGYMPNADFIMLNMENGPETNQLNEFQGKFQKGNLDVNLINYALKSDSNFLNESVKKNLVITCYDQYPINISDFLSKIDTKFENVYVSNSQQAKDFTKWNP